MAAHNKAIQPTPQRRPLFAKGPQKTGPHCPRLIAALYKSVNSRSNIFI